MPRRSDDDDDDEERRFAPARSAATKGGRRTTTISAVSWYIVKQEQAETIGKRRDAYIRFQQSSSYSDAVASSTQRALERVRSSSPGQRRPPSPPTGSYQFETEDPFLTRLNQAEADDKRLMQT
jgi:hypothetical protein